MSSEVRRGLLLAALAAGLAAPAGAEIVAQGDTGFAVRAEVPVAADPSHVWSMLVTPGRWWSGAHSWSGDAANMTLEARPGGCFCEALPGRGVGAGVEHARVVHVDPPRLLRLVGALGPLQAEALAGTLSITLTPQGTGTRIRFDYAVAGHAAAFKLETIAPAVNGVIAEQAKRLAALAEGRAP